MQANTEDKRATAPSPRTRVYSTMCTSGIGVFTVKSQISCYTVHQMGGVYVNGHGFELANGNNGDFFFFFLKPGCSCALRTP